MLGNISEEDKKILSTPQAGDIILLDGNSKLSDSLILAQKTIYSKSQSSHVEVMIDDGVVLHATGDKGVHLAFLPDELKQAKSNWRVIRNKNLATAENFENFSIQFFYFLNQTYNKVFMGAGNEYSSFCSELAAKCYEKIGFKIFEQRPSKVAPAHFDKLCDEITDDSEWIDVTENYKIYLDLLFNNHELRQVNRMAYATLKTGLFKRALLAPYREYSLSIMYEFAEKAENTEMISKLEEFRKIMKEQRHLSFWNETDHEFGLKTRPNVNILEDFTSVHTQIYLHYFEALKEPD